ncbi:MAG: glycosyltransferase family 2 protein [Bacteroidia bacterium]
MEFKISIITINYNNAEGLKQTFDSVRTQTLKGIDYVVVDGGSNDGSKELIEQNKDIISYSCSEKDKGIYDAQNKGILKSNGSYLIFLNSGDVFASTDFLSKTIEFSNANQNYSLIYCNTILKNSDGSLYNIVQSNKLDLCFFYDKTLNHQSCLIKRELFDKYGLYDIGFKICADFDFILKAFINDPAQFVHFNEFAVIYENNGFSANPANYNIVVSERKQIVERHFTKKQIADCIKEERARNTWQTNTRKQLYANKATYPFIKFYVKIKELIWKK